MVRLPREKRLPCIRYVRHSRQPRSMELWKRAGRLISFLLSNSLVITQLALVHMSDHYTRITMGGSPLPKESPVVGVLFGTPGILLDAEDISLDAGELQQAVQLHQAVFPQNIVLGSYRVTNKDSEPTADDLKQVMALQKTFGTTTYFGLLYVNPVKKKESKSINEELPLQLFTLQDNSVLVAVEDWQLTTAAAERVAVERVLRDKPAREQEQIQQAWMALDTRLQQLSEYLTHTTTTTTPEQYEMWRQIQGLLMQARLLRTTPRQASLLPEQVAVLAKTVDAVAWYTDKFRVMHGVKGKPSAASLLDTRRF